MKKYNYLLESQPLITVCFTGSILFIAGDSLAQIGLEKRGFGRDKKFDWARLVIPFINSIS